MVIISLIEKYIFPVTALNELKIEVKGD